MKLLLIFSILIILLFNILTLNYQFFSYQWFDFNLLFLLIFAFLHPDYKKSIPLAIILGIFSGLNSILPINTFVITYLLITLFVILIIRNLMAVNLLSIIPLSFFALVVYQVLVVCLTKIYFFLGFSDFNIVLNKSYLKNLLNLSITHSILLVLLYGMIIWYKEKGIGYRRF